MHPLATDIEMFLLTERRWVTADEICQRFNLNERALRSKGREPGLCTDLIISGDKGYRHLRCATDEERGRFLARIDSHWISEKDRADRVREAIKNAITGQPPVEKFTGQTLMRI